MTANERRNMMLMLAAQAAAKNASAAAAATSADGSAAEATQEAAPAATVAPVAAPEAPKPPPPPPILPTREGTGTREGNTMGQGSADPNIGAASDPISRARRQFALGQTLLTGGALQGASAFGRQNQLLGR